ncbi:conserved hypothetical protein [Vibrio crassostreae]|uniref:hypothetical protein n=1 Tax=Vibrio crassostreae TaxID=246167 RepID=UPI001B3001E8|nr:hypothetical protein [Vibrio crassostreae]CAK1691273.1 conserved hypothetical protein [Vibrio crassostreae]CAK1707460.1 conserved hypothetical protein [Vibrio crassostreae]CAK1725610.1 conserved hypothetical protein [Vibrio crassostreae]CAK1726571.1 conserved hypothetical protein [Vibrio crassostreae]CAK1727738.1 conserved hypothetical protein [Vibrio crassostreae]
MSNEEKLTFVIDSFRKLKIEQSLIKSIESLDTVKNTPGLEKLEWKNNKFLIFLKNQEYISIETESYKLMSLEDKLEFANEHLNSSGINPDQLDYIGDESELQSKTQALLLSWALGGLLLAGVFYFIFS